MAATKEYWTGKKVLVTGGAGFIGSHVTEQLVALGARVRVTNFGEPKPEEARNIASVRDQIEIVTADLTKIEDAVRVCKGQDVVLNLAAHVGGIGYNKTHPATMFRDNVWIATTTLEGARQASVKRFLVVSSACVYSNDASIPTPESEGFLGEPETTNNGYGWSKRMAEYDGQAYAKEFGMEIAIVRPYNSFGPRDHFDPVNGHVIPSFIVRLMNGEKPLTIWGTGSPTRSFIYVDDFARGLIETTEKYPQADPVNIGSDEEISMRDLAQLIIDEMGSSTTVAFDTSKPDGQPRRAADVTKAKEKVGFEAEISLREGIRRTIEWYKANHGETDPTP